MTNSRGQPCLNATNKKLKIPRYLKIANNNNAANNTNDNNAKADFI